MSIRSMLSKKRPQSPAAAPERECGHWELAPRWGCNDDIGKDDRVTFYTCSTCGRSFSREEAATMRSSG